MARFDPLGFEFVENKAWPSIGIYKTTVPCSEPFTVSRAWDAMVEGDAAPQAKTFSEAMEVAYCVALSD